MGNCSKKLIENKVSNSNQIDNKVKFRNQIENKVSCSNQIENLASKDFKWNKNYKIQISSKILKKSKLFSLKK